LVLETALLLLSSLILEIAIQTILKLVTTFQATLDLPDLPDFSAWRRFSYVYAHLFGSRRHRRL
jgi:hypothetical protein